MDGGTGLNEKEVIILLQQCEAEISKLLYQLEQQQSLKSSLKQKLDVIRSLKVPTTPCSPVLFASTMPLVPPVDRIPKEIILMVFSELIHNDPLAIGPLLLVCRRWNKVICRSPLLWSRISAYLAPHPPAVQRWAAYVTAAIRYSGNTPLHVDITLPSFYDLWSLLSLKLLDLSPQFIYEDGWTVTNKGTGSMELNNRIEEVADWLNDAYDASTMPFSLVEQADSAISDGMISISDATTSHLSRIRSLTLRFHQGKFADCLHDSTPKFFPTLGETATPMLEELTVVDREAVLDPDNSVFTHPIPSLTRLAWGVAWPITTVLAPAPLGRLTHLRLLVYQDLPPSNYTCNITHLFLDWIWSNSQYSGQNFYFPRLEDLTLYGLSGPCPIEAPHLTTLRLVNAETCRSVLGNLPSFPLLAKLHVWASPIDALKNLEVYMSQLPLLMELAFLYFSKDSMGELKNLVRDDKISVKAYQYIPGKNHWEFTSYEHDGITFN